MYSLTENGWECNKLFGVILLLYYCKERGMEVVCHDLNRGDWSKAVADAFCYDRLVLASITLAENHVTIRSAVNETVQKQVEALVEELCGRA